MAADEKPPVETIEDQKNATETKAIETAVTAQKLDPETLAAEVESLKAALTKANNESAGRRKEIDAYKKSEKDKADAELSEIERLKKSDAEKDALAATLRAELQTTRIHHAVEMAAKELFFHDPADALTSEVISAVKQDDSGKVDTDSVRKALEKLLKAKSYLAGKPGTQPGTPSSQLSRPRPPAVETTAAPRRRINF